MSIINLAEAKQQLDIDPSDMTDDAEIQSYLDGIGTAIEDYLKKVVEQRTIEDEDLTLRGAWSFWLRQSPVISLTSLVSLDSTTTYDVTTLVARPSGKVLVVSGPRPVGRVVATYEAGYAVIPDNLKNAAKFAIQDVWETQRGVGTEAAGVEDAGDFTRANLSHLFLRRARIWLGGDPSTLAG